MLLRDKVIFLTGAADGIGRECALACAREGAFVGVVDINAARASEVARELGDHGLALACDVSSQAAVELAVRATLQRFGRIDAVHNNAGVSAPSKPLHETTEAEWDQLLNVNLKSILWTTRSAIEALKRSRGSIVNTASLVGLIGQSNHAAYSATKGAMITLTKSMALDYARFGIRVNAVCPAGIWTPMLVSWAREQPDPQSISSYLDQIHALGYCPRGDVVADAVVFLLSDHARFITGCILPVSGGAELGYKR